MEVSFREIFKRAFKKCIKGRPMIETGFWKKLQQFTLDPSLKTHKSSGKLKEPWSFSVAYDARVLFYFTEDDKAVFVDIGSHDEVY